MSEEQCQPLSEDTQAEDQRHPIPHPWEDWRSCALCGDVYRKDEMVRVDLDEPGAKDWVCEVCHEAGQQERDTSWPNHSDE